MKQLYRADLHVHSSFSNKPSVWAIRKVNCPESYTTPEFIYKTAAEKGMSWVTITDHNTINGALEIAHLPGTFISVEATSYFPEDGCKIHVVALDITEDRFKDIMGLRKNVYELAAYLREAGIIHFVAHPLYDMNGKLTVETIEKMLLLFEVFEIKNGARADRFNKLIQYIVSSLTRERIEAISDKQGIVPSGSRPWKKALVGGSDDHSGFFIARAHTVSSEGKTIKEFISSIRENKTWAEGDDGDPLTLAHSIYGIGYRFYTERVKPSGNNSMPFVSFLLNKCLKTEPARLSLIDKVKFFIRKNIPEIYDYSGKSFEEILDSEAKKLLNDASFLRSIHAEDRNQKIFKITSYLANRIGFIYTNQMLKMPLGNGIFRIFQQLSTLGIIQVLISPYYLAYYHQHKNKKLLRQLRDSFTLSDRENRREKTALFTDTINEINGVAITIKRLIETAKDRGIELKVITCSNKEGLFNDGVQDFQSVGDFALPEYPELRLHFPPVLDVMDYFERGGFTRIHVSTPGPIGLLALFIAKLMDIPISATYHTDIPQYVKSLTNDAFLEHTAWNYIIWFYDQMDEVMVPSQSTQDQLIERGLPLEKVRPLPRWVDTETFSPLKKQSAVWKKYDLDEEIKLLYVGRVSKEKNLGILADAFIDIINEGYHSHLVIVGDGPYREELENKLKGYPALFTGFIRG